MDDLIEALKIFRKYMNEDEYSPTNCEHDIFRVAYGITPNIMPPIDVRRLRELSFIWDEDLSCWSSFRFGSA